MAHRPVLQPGDDHPIEIVGNPHHVVVRVCGQIVADTKRALTLREADYPAVQYIPRADVEMARLRRSDHVSYCPYKGEACYFDLPALGDQGADAVWTYEAPFAPVAAIGGHLAFYPDRAEIEELPE